MILGVSVFLFGLTLYTYVGYPLLLRLLLLLRGPRQGSAVAPPDVESDWPEVSIVLTMHNGAAFVKSKLESLAASDYPGLITVNFVLDGCTDGTADRIQEHIAGGYRYPVNVWPQAERHGKESAIRNALPNLPGSILMFSDADAELAHDAIRFLVLKLMEPGVGVACGREIHTTSSEAGAGSGQGAFYRYEHAIKRFQEELTSLTYVQGGVFAMWKDLYPPQIPVGATQDGAIAFHTVLSGRRVSYVVEATSQEPYNISTAADFSRRIRTISRAFYTICCYPQILFSTRQGFFGWHVLSNRLLRWMTIPIVILANFCLLPSLFRGNPTPLVILVCEVVWIALATAGWALERQKRRWKLAYFCYYFTYIHLAATVAMMKILRGQRTSTWTPTTN